MNTRQIWTNQTGKKYYTFMQTHQQQSKARMGQSLNCCHVVYSFLTKLYIGIIDMAMKLISWYSWCPIRTLYVRPNLICLQLSSHSLYKLEACICLVKYVKLHNFTSVCVKSILSVTMLQLQAKTSLVFTYQLQITKHYHAATDIKITAVGSRCCLVYQYWIQCKATLSLQSEVT